MCAVRLLQVVLSAMALLIGGAAQSEYRGSLATVEIESLIDRSEQIAVVEITQAKAQEFFYAGDRSTCGVIYSGEVMETLKGKESQHIEFSGPLGIVVGRQYLLLLGPTPRTLYPEGAKPVWLDGEPPFSEAWREAVEVCYRQLPDLTPYGAGTFELVHPLTSEGEQWLKSTWPDLQYPASVSVRPGMSAYYLVAWSGLRELFETD